MLALANGGVNNPVAIIKCLRGVKGIMMLGFARGGTVRGDPCLKST